MPWPSRSKASGHAGRHTTLLISGAPRTSIKSVEGQDSRGGASERNPDYGSDRLTLPVEGAFTGLTGLSAAETIWA